MYSISNMKMDRKPPLPRSPMRLRPRRSLHSSNPTAASSVQAQTPILPGSFTKYQKLPNRSLDIEESALRLRPEYRTISSELRDLAKMVGDELGNADRKNICGADCASVNSGMVFERGRFYDEYSARRNERLKRKKGVSGDEEGKPVHVHLHAPESAKKSSCRKLERLRKSVSVEASETTPRYMLRSMTKENKKPRLAANFDKSLISGGKKMGPPPTVRRI